MVIPVSDTAISSIHEATPGGFRFRPGMKPPELFDESLAKSFGEKNDQRSCAGGNHTGNVLVSIWGII